MELFENTEETKQRIVLSASRMSDMPAFYPHEIIQETQARIDKGRLIHTLVLWTKHPVSLLKEPLNSFLTELKKKQVQISVQLSITGMGGKSAALNGKNGVVFPERNTPSARDALLVLPEIIRLTGDPCRIYLRIDPLVKIRDIHGKIYSNFPDFEEIMKQAVGLGIQYFVFSFLKKGIHRKVDHRFQKAGLDILDFSKEEEYSFRKMIKIWEREYGIEISACCVDNFPESSCINGKRLQKTHEHFYSVKLKQLRRRPRCGCTFSIDLGGWPPKKCHSGCLYCYANPLI